MITTSHNTLHVALRTNIIYNMNKETSGCRLTQQGLVQNGRHLADDIPKFFSSMNLNCYLFQISMKFPKWAI